MRTRGGRGSKIPKILRTYLMEAPYERMNSCLNTPLLTLAGAQSPYLQDTYRELVGFLVESQSEAANRERLSEAFAELTRNTPFTADRINRIRDDKRRTERDRER